MASGRKPPGRHRRQGGFTLLGILFLVAALGVGLAALGTLWETAGRREKETQLLFAGDQYRRAIASFWRASPAGQSRLPKSVEELLRDPRFPHVVRHLRRVYPDPVTGRPEWGLVRRDDGIAGVHSLSEAKPYKTAGFGKEYAAFEKASRYADWVFEFDAAAKPAQEMPPSEGGRNAPAKDAKP
jgi:type II secretory pathway pseudopilin PulG